MDKVPDVSGPGNVQPLPGKIAPSAAPNTQKFYAFDYSMSSALERAVPQPPSTAPTSSSGLTPAQQEALDELNFFGDAAQLALLLKSSSGSGYDVNIRALVQKLQGDIAQLQSDGDTSFLQEMGPLVGEISKGIPDFATEDQFVADWFGSSPFGTQGVNIFSKYFTQFSNDCSQVPANTLSLDGQMSVMMDTYCMMASAEVEQPAGVNPENTFWGNWVMASGSFGSLFSKFIISYFWEKDGAAAGGAAYKQFQNDVNQFLSILPPSTGSNYTSAVDQLKQDISKYFPASSTAANWPWSYQPDEYIGKFSSMFDIWAGS